VADGGPPGSGPYYGIAAPANGTVIFVAPQAASGSWVTSNENGSDIHFVNAMLSTFEAQLCLDESRLFSVGFSRGAMMTITIGCAEGSVFRAIAAMSGELSTSCSNGHPIAYWASHGMSDPTIAIADGQKARDKFVALNHCTGPGSSPDSNGCITYQGCDAAYPVVWCPFDGVHQPPPFAGAAIWKFLSQF
jgi:polyhydroxybutyrate depolymerase